MDVAVDAGRSQNQMFARNGVGRGTRHQIGIDALHGVRIACLAQPGDFAILDADVGLDDTHNGVDDCDVRNHQVQRTLFGGHRVGQTHAVAQCFAAAVNHLVAVFAEVFFDFDIQIAVAQPDFVSFGWAEQVVVFLT